MDKTGAEDPVPAGQPHPNPRHRLRQLWRRRSRQTGWDPPDDWWTPSVETLCAAAVEDTDMAEGCARFGQARARSGVTIGAALDDFAAFSDVVGWPAPPRRLVKAVAEGWADAGRSQDDCQDPLTGLCTAAYLRTRLDEVYREANPGDPHMASHKLIVVSLDPRINPWRRTARLIVLGYELRRIFGQGETVALLSRSRIGVLTPVRTNLVDHVRDLRAALCAENEADAWTVPLPESYADSLELLDDIGKPRMNE
ncbi:hypothetical protein F4561_005965 [Lipingzhangella halophila]|uniref:GGDEF domain-containing protein n=1 Tax=Lipingzhangella halophila TaxID=1783352 RepID=A0A7W7W5R9_9ACTN|nr:hypothetical protein [Lipingzhangella halophila]MBB4935071.1 hypothetical protein [Lipingzhangella halophila]